MNHLFWRLLVTGPFNFKIHFFLVVYLNQFFIYGFNYLIFVNFIFYFRGYIGISFIH